MVQFAAGMEEMENEKYVPHRRNAMANIYENMDPELIERLFPFECDSSEITEMGLNFERILQHLKTRFGNLEEIEKSDSEKEQRRPSLFRSVSCVSNITDLHCNCKTDKARRNGLPNIFENFTHDQKKMLQDIFSVHLKSKCGIISV